MANIVFLEIEHDGEWALASVGPAYIAAGLKQKGHSVALLRVPAEMTIQSLLTQIANHQPDLIGISLTSRQWLRAALIVPKIKKNFDIPVIAGGLHPTFASALVLDTPGFDYVCIGEGELAMLEFVESLEQGRPLKGLKNIRAKGEPVPKLHPPFESLDDLPFMARDMLDEKYGVVHISTQRGCPYPCTYCAAPKIADLYEGGYSNYGRRRSPENVIAELAEITHNGELNYVVFLDDTFTINHAWIQEFCHSYSQHFRIPFSINARAETINEKLLRILAYAGCMHIIFGVESGSERLRRNVLKRNISNKRLIEVFRWTRDAGIMVTANYMLGIPDEKKSDIEQTLALHDQLQPDDFGYFVFYPYPGTPLFYECKEKGYLPENSNDLPANHRSSILTLPDLSKEDIEYYYDQFTQLRIRDHSRNVPGNANHNYTEQVVKQMEDAAARG